MSASPTTKDVTLLLQRVAAGHADANNALYDAVYADLNRIARHRLFESGMISVLDSPGLVAEAYLRLVGKESGASENRKMFFAYASKVMRNILLDHIREQAAEKRGGGLADMTLHTGVAGQSYRIDQWDSLKQALDRLGRVDVRACTLVELRYFGGLSMDECAEHLGISPATAARDWEKARGFLAMEMG
jgi:RNA polymerase sigma factor (TIGR02999 family)